MKPLTIIVYTHCRTPERQSYALCTLHALSQNVIYDGPLRLHVADDNSTEELWAGIQERATLVCLTIRDQPYERVTFSRAGGLGYGGSYNRATQVLHDEDGYFLCVEDDWEMQGAFDFTPYAEAIEARPDLIGCIRFGYLGHTGRLSGRIEWINNLDFLVFDPDCPERHVFAGHPRLESRDWQRKVGPWPEGEDAGTTEFKVAGRDEAREGVAWPIGIAPGRLFAHIGTIQAREDQSP